MELLKDILGIQIKYEKWAGQLFLPMYMAEQYDIQGALLNGCKCIILSPTGELPTLPALKKQIKKIQEIEPVPVVLKLSAVSFYRRKNLIENRIPFFTNRQAYFPFMGTYLEKENTEPVETKKLMFSTQQLVLLYLYSGKKKFYASDALQVLPFTAMTLSRAVRQIEMLDFFTVTKDGVHKVIEAKESRKALFEKMKMYLSTPVRREGYIEKAKWTENMVLAGETALAEQTMLNPEKVRTYAVFAKNIDKKLLTRELIDPEKQIRVELWEYDPRQFSKDGMADTLSLALSLKDHKDERIEEAVESLLEKVWEE